MTETCTETDGGMLARLGTDALLWAAEFAKTFIGIADRSVADDHAVDVVRSLLVPTGGDLLHVWLCSAIEAGRSAGYESAMRHVADSLPPSVALHLATRFTQTVPEATA